jgi:AraC family transcriptional regulator, arabinose operon regulatory protein
MFLEESYESDAGLIICGIASKETLPAGSAVDMPKGCDGYTLVHFLNDGVVLTSEGNVTVWGGACVLYPSKVPQHYSGDKSSLNFDRIRITGPLSHEVIERSALPLNQVYYPGAWQYTNDAINIIALERLGMEEGWQYAVAAHAELLFIRQRRNLMGTAYKKTSAIALDRLRSVRLHIRRHPGRKWSVEIMAREASLSRSRYTALHRAFFKISPMEDVIRVRLDMARQLLANSELTISQISLKSGFDDVSYFCRLFKQRIGCTPGKYRAKK